jgi:aminodeoxyfutalosine synthase
MEDVTGLQMLAERVSAGDEVTEADASILLESRDLIAVGAIADDARRRLHGARTTFVRVLEIHVDAPPVALPSPLAAGEIRIVGVPASLEVAVAAVAAVRTLAGSVPLTGFSLADLSGFGMPLGDVARRLRDAGLDALAEVPVETANAAAVASLREAGLAAYRLTVESYGGGPSAAIVARAAELQRSLGSFKAFAPLPRAVSPVTPTTGYDDVKLVAMARLMTPAIPSIQVDWPLYGPKLAQVALTMGADDVDGIAAFEPAVLGTRRSALAEITGNIRAAALEPVERDGRFESRE